MTAGSMNRQKGRAWAAKWMAYIQNRATAAETRHRFTQASPLHLSSSLPLVHPRNRNAMLPMWAKDSTNQGGNNKWAGEALKVK